MLVAQLTDLHLEPAGGANAATNLRRFQDCVDTLRNLLRPPDLYLISGDIAEHGDAASYRSFFEAMRVADRPWLCLLGNHDCADAFAQVASKEKAGGFNDTDDFRLGNWRILCVDTALQGSHSGFFDQHRANRLAAALAADPLAPTIIAMHHPPVQTGVEWIDPAAGEPWIKRFGEAIAPFQQVRQIVCGHVHMAVMTRFRGTALSIAPATAPQLWPEMAPQNQERPDGRMMVVDGQPGFALHRLGEKGVTTIFGAPALGRVRLRLDEAPGASTE